MNQNEKDELLIRLDERTKILLEKFDTLLEKNETLEKRLSAVEHWQLKVVGVATGISFSVSAAFTSLPYIGALLAGKGGS